MLANDTNRTFHLKNGDKITGKVLNETKISYDIETTFGKVTIFKDEINTIGLLLFFTDFVFNVLKRISRKTL